jgi:DNA-directed RNA polymerase specialized sigma24 family protein
MLFGLITAMIPDRPLAEEILQRIFVEVWQKAKALNDQTESISEWLWQRCRVLCMVSYNQNIQAIAGK